jgi:hypothetical protein
MPLSGKTHQLNVIILLVAFIMPLWAPVSAQGPTVISLTLSSMSPSSQEVMVTPSSIGDATFNLTATVEMPPLIPMTVMVTLDGSTSTGWPTVVSPQSIPFTTANSVQITITVVVPQATPTSSIGKVIVSGLATYPGGSKTATSSAVVTVHQYYRVQPMANNQNVTTINDTLSMVLSIYNRGNGIDQFDIELTNRADLEAKGLSVEFNQTRTFSVPQDEYCVILITVSYDGSKRPIKEPLNILVTSVGAKNANEPVSKSIILMVKFEPDPSLEAFLKNPFKPTTKENYIFMGSLIATILSVIVVVSLVLYWRKRRKGRSRIKTKGQTLKPGGLSPFKKS